MVGIFHAEHLKILVFVPSAAILCYHHIVWASSFTDKHAQQSGIRPEKLQPLENLACGGFAGILGQTTSYPLDIVRRRMQTAGVTGHPEYCLSIITTLRIVYNAEGLFHGLYKGVTLNWIKGPIASSISFTVFHQVQHLLHWYDRYHSQRPTG
ncbi:putative Mitochondrial coenzyme A transporter SLC25A42 [Fasciolopsis buskii]|uniref:Putative Mitochondrial coenzyme A transporter SLC25A42 n=1 Tax=Fasciolopsis buskii TaxID=27845 RepID=A0A8E0S426_9TREM|nr:putative Mitochondrial coenzyme A transporter SLC25A42 [Fasciolopsis buski]